MGDGNGGGFGGFFKNFWWVFGEFLVGLMIDREVFSRGFDLLERYGGVVGDFVWFLLPVVLIKVVLSH